MDGAIQVSVCLYFSPAIGGDSITNDLNLQLSDGTKRVLNLTFGRNLNRMSFVKSVAILPTDEAVQVFVCLYFSPAIR